MNGKHCRACSRGDYSEGGAISTTNVWPFAVATTRRSLPARYTAVANGSPARQSKVFRLGLQELRAKSLGWGDVSLRCPTYHLCTVSCFDPVMSIVSPCLIAALVVSGLYYDTNTAHACCVVLIVAVIRRPLLLS